VDGYERHEAEKTLLHRVIREQLEGFLSYPDAFVVAGA